MPFPRITATTPKTTPIMIHFISFSPFEIHIFACIISFFADFVKIRAKIAVKKSTKRFRKHNSPFLSYNILTTSKNMSFARKGGIIFERKHMGQGDPPR